ncbi:MAG: 30S ribosomal protein S20 [Patescibacteria group bacterium]|jgi:small subunit ribosomal protein S20|nr:30S ribosomal protein S20 [Patescibacteria group bacterium]
MANTKSANKEIRKNATNEAYNKKIKDTAKSLIKRSKKAIEANDPKAGELVQSALKSLDKAAQKGVIKKNTKDRKKSRLHQALNESTTK